VQSVCGRFHLGSVSLATVQLTPASGGQAGETANTHSGASVAEAEQLATAAKLNNQTLSEWIRRTVLAALNA